MKRRSLHESSNGLRDVGLTRASTMTPADLPTVAADPAASRQGGAAVSHRQQIRRGSEIVGGPEYLMRRRLACHRYLDGTGPVKGDST